MAGGRADPGCRNERVRLGADLRPEHIRHDLVEELAGYALDQPGKHKGVRRRVFKRLARFTSSLERRDVFVG